MWTGLSKQGVVARVQAVLSYYHTDSVVYNGTLPNPTTRNVAEGLEILKRHQCDCVISIGGGSPHDCAKGIALVATNGGISGTMRCGQGHSPTVTTYRH